MTGSHLNLSLKTTLDEVIDAASVRGALNRMLRIPFERVYCARAGRAVKVDKGEEEEEEERQELQKAREAHLLLRV